MHDIDNQTSLERTKPMIKKSIFVPVALVAISVFAVAAIIQYDLSSKKSAVSSDQNTSSSIAMWGSKAVTVDELMREADLVVRVKASSNPVSRMVGFTQKKIEVRGDERKPAGTYVDNIIFSDTNFEVLRLYKGQLPKELVVVQTGGINPKIPDHVEQFPDDPIYKLGEEYVLFLKDFSDPVHGNRAVYFTLNPSGRYIINGDSVKNYANSALNSEGKNIPQNIGDLEAQIASSVVK
jgi:hypothetical protein